MADIGYIALFLALVASGYSAIAFIFGASKRHPELIDSARNGLVAVCGLVSISVAVLLIALLTHNFQIEYVASYTSRDTPLIYLISALWAGNEGSLLFWAWLLSIFAAIAVVQKRDKGTEFVPYAAAIAMLTESFFLILFLSVSNPFQQLPFVPADGKGLNPMLENAGMIFHPPLLLAGYVGLTIPFAFAIGALLKRKTDNEWLESVRGWTLLSWLLLGVGNIIGAWWAYVELGWGGYWAWDPVENAGLMPWLVATAFLHSSIIQRRRGMLKVWNLVLVILAFNLAIFGTFLTRSGFLSSVHTFSESGLGPFFLPFLFIAFFSSLGLLYYRKQDLEGGAEMKSLASREGTFSLNIFLLLGITIVTFIGTVFPAISEALGGTKIGVGESFFNQVNGPLFLAVIVLVGICTIIGWRRITTNDMTRGLLPPLAATIILGIVFVILGMREWYALIASLLCSLALLSVIYTWFREIRELRHKKRVSFLKAFYGLFANNRVRYGAYIVHIAIVVIAIGVIGSSVYQVQKQATLKPGDSMTIEGYTLTYNGRDVNETQDKAVVAATLSLYNGEQLIDTLVPKVSFHRSYKQPVSEVAIHSTLVEDLYVILGAWKKDGTATFKALINPLVIWIWIGGGIFLFGGLVALWPGRRKPVSFKTSVADSQKGADLEDEIEKRVQGLRRHGSQFCPRCGARCQKTDRFCSRCGTLLGRGGTND